MTTLDAVARKKAQASAEELAAAELVRMAKEQGLSLTGPNGLLKQFTKTVLETALNEEMTEHLGLEPNQAPAERDSANVRNGTRPKTVLTEVTGPVPIEVPRDRDGSFEPQIVRTPPSTPPQRGRRWMSSPSDGARNTVRSCVFGKTRGRSSFRSSTTTSRSDVSSAARTPSNRSMPATAARSRHEATSRPSQPP